MKRWLLSALLLFTGWVHADGITDATVYVPITVEADYVDEAIPYVIIYASSLPNELYTALSTASDTTGETLRWTNADGSVELPIYVASLNTGTKLGCIIAGGSGMSASTDTVYRLYAGSPTANMYAVTDTYGRNAVFSSYAGVYLPGMTTDDLTGNARNLTAVNTPGTAASGFEGITAATYTAASTQYHHYAGAAVIAPPITVEALAYSNNATTSYIITGVFFDGSAGQNQAYLAFEGATVNDPVRTKFQGTSGTNSVADYIGYSASTWYYLAGTRDLGGAGTSFVYLNGTSGTNTSTIAAYTNSPNRFSIGVRNDSALDSYLDGRVAYVALDNVVQSANYVNTVYDAWYTAAFTAEGAAVTIDPACTSGSTGWVLFGSIAQTATAATDWANITDALVDNGNTADVTLDDVTNIESEQLLFDNITYGTTVPTNADSYTVSFRIKHDFASGSGKAMEDNLVKFINETGAVEGDNVASAVNWSTTPETYEYTVTGVTFTGTEFDADTGLAFSATGFNTNGNTLTEVYVAWVKIDWVCGSDPSALSREFFELGE